MNDDDKAKKQPNEDKRKEQWRHRFLIVVRYLVVVSVLALILVAGVVNLELLLFCVLVGVFPVTAIAYYFSHQEQQMDDLARDYLALGLREDKTPDTDQGSAKELAKRSQSRMQSPFHYVLLVLPLMVLAFLGVVLVFRPGELPLWSHGDPDLIAALRYGFVGSYVFSIFLVYRRYTTADLMPQVYLCCTKAIILGFAFNFVTFTAVNMMFAADAQARQPVVPATVDEGKDEDQPSPDQPSPDQPSTAQPPTAQQVTSAGAGIVAIVAFSFGFFPYLAVRWISRMSYGALGERRRRSEFRPLDLIDGISQLHETRLRDEGIDNLQNLASARIDKLLVSTPFGAQEIVEWIDQAILYLHLEISDADSFRRSGIRTITGFHRYWENLRNGKQDDRKGRAQLLQTTPERLDSIFDATQVGPNMAYIRHYWQNLLVEATRISEGAKLMKRLGNITGEKRKQFLEDLDPEEKKELEEVAGEAEIETLALDELLGGGTWAENEKDFSTAERYYEAARRRFPKDPRAYNALAWMYLTQPVEHKGDKVQEARKWAARAVQLSDIEDGEPNPYYLDTLALAFVNMNDPDGALEAMERAIKIDPKDPYYLGTLAKVARAFVEAKNVDKALSIVEKIEKAGYADDKTSAEVSAIRKEIEEATTENGN